MSRPHHTPPAAALCLAAIALVTAASGCAPAEPVRAGRGVLGTVIQATVYGDPDQARSRLETAFSRMRAVEAELDSYDPSSAVSAINASPREWHTLPASAVEVLGAVERAGVADRFSPGLWALAQAYDFGGDGRVPDTATVLALARAGRRIADDGGRVRLDPATASSIDTSVGLDFGGAAKGLALDRAAAALRDGPGVTGALLSAGSSTITFGKKDDGGAWRVGVEDPRDDARIAAVISISRTDTFSISTSGDYQTYFERDGVRYHHILDPATGRPARGTRSLTVFAPVPALETDVLSTALFVMGPEESLRYARGAGLGVFIIDAAGRSHLYLPAGMRGVTLDPDEDTAR